MYLRFVTARPVDGMKAREGFFQAAGDVADDPMTDAVTLARVDALRDWFSENMEAPLRFSRTQTKNFRRTETRGLSWFKPTATAHIAKAFELKGVLDECGYPIEVLRETRIGYVIYEDAHQVVAEPFADTVT